jgi:hypothetical protein
MASRVQVGNKLIIVRLINISLSPGRCRLAYLLFKTRTLLPTGQLWLTWVDRYLCRESMYCCFSLNTFFVRLKMLTFMLSFDNMCYASDVAIVSRSSLIISVCSTFPWSSSLSDVGFFSWSQTCVGNSGSILSFIRAKMTMRRSIANFCWFLRLWSIYWYKCDYILSTSSLMKVSLYRVMISSVSATMFFPALFPMIRWSIRFICGSNNPTTHKSSSSPSIPWWNGHTRESAERSFWRHLPSIQP